MTPKIGDLIGAAAGVVVFAQGAAEHRWPTVAEKAFPFAALVLLVIFGGALSAQWRSMDRVARIDQASGNAFKAASLAHALGACLRLGAAPALWIAAALATLGYVFGWNAFTLRLIAGASILAFVILVVGLLQYAFVARNSASKEEAGRKAR